MAVVIAMICGTSGGPGRITELLEVTANQRKKKDTQGFGEESREPSTGKDTGVSCHALLQGIFPTQGSNLRLLRLLHCR
ncbi:small integral membrane protein 7 isoform X6 [Ovis aries]|uniref:small integral membrane protein 7 isoform X6 n=1 Tax=Ovis aries TaxID=9940 RepID=UPI0029528640|nr:small integral membrane protein 7 isoform X6 [Ovis aries]